MNREEENDDDNKIIRGEKEKKGQREKDISST